MLKRHREIIGSILGADSPQGRVTVTVPNWLTLIRLAIVPVFWWCFLETPAYLRIAATFLFIVGALSDLWDGMLARRLGQETAFGNFMDPLADKLLTLSAFWAILLRESFGVWLIPAAVCVGLITLREAAITILRTWAIGGGSSLVTSLWGKWKTGIQIVTLIWGLLLLNLGDLLPPHSITATWLQSLWFDFMMTGLFLLSAVSSLISGALYISGGLRSNLK
ncbi:MAG: CDP-diacylglycerol--glycerol-3-phosphate 3-phosphatidyltransferase [Calditrichota bacterium]